MFRARRKPKMKIWEVINVEDYSEHSPAKVWDRMMVEFGYECISTVAGPKFYSLSSDAYDYNLDNGWTGFKKYIVDKGMGIISIYVPEDF